MYQNHPKSAKLSKIERTWSLNNPHGQKRIIKVNQNELNGLKLIVRMYQTEAK